jgi:hypothetical protein
MKTFRQNISPEETTTLHTCNLSIKPKHSAVTLSVNITRENAIFQLALYLFCFAPK